MNRTEKIDADGVWKHIADTYTVGQDITRSASKVVSGLGVFVSLEPGFDALIHVSKIAGLGDQDPRRFYAAGQKVNAKIINMDSRNHRVELETHLHEFSHEGFIPSENEQLVAEDVDLDNLEVTGAVLNGAWIQDRPSARVELVARSDAEMSFQLQAKCSHWDRQALKAVHVVLRQDGKNVVARADWAAYTTLDHDYGYDLTKLGKRENQRTDDEGWADVATAADADGYGVAELHFRRKPSLITQVDEDEFRTTECEAKPILVDGSNIVRRWPNLRSEALASLLEGLKVNGYVPTVFFDANIHHVLEDSRDVFGQKLLGCMMQEDPEHTIIVPSGMRADDYMLLLADRRGYQITSCDTYQDEAFARYSWLKNRVESGEKRVHAPAFILGDLVIPTLGIVCPFAQSSLEKPLFKGDVFIQSYGNGEFFCAEDESQGISRPILANRDNPSDWERFVLTRNSDGSISMKSRVNGRYLSADIDADGHLNARAEHIDEWEKFWLSKRANDGHYVLRSCANMKYVSVDSRSGQVIAQASVAGEWEWLTITPCV